MNTIRSTWIGWGALTIAGAGSYYFAKKSINADKKLRFEQDQKSKRAAAQLEEEERIRRTLNPPPSHQKAYHKGSDHASNPSGEASLDPAPTSHSLDTGSSIPKSKYEPKETFKSRKGDRFS